MRICLVAGEYPPMQGGVGDYSRELCRALVRQGVEADVVTSQPRGDTRALAAEVDSPPDDPCAVERVVGDWSWRCWSPIRSAAKRARADVIHIQYQAAAYDMRPAINMLPLLNRVIGAGRPRTAVTFHDLLVPYVFPKAGPLRWAVVRSLAQWSDAVIVTNMGDHRKLSRHGLDPHVIAIGSNIAPRLPDNYDRDELRRRWGAGPDDFIVCHFGFVNERKGIEILLRSLLLSVQNPAQYGQWRLLMIGGKVGSSDATNVYYLRRVEATIDQLGLREHISWTGFIAADDVSACFAAADCCVLPYRDGATLRHGTLMAALAHGMAIVTTMPPRSAGQVGAGSDLSHEEQVLLVPPDEPMALAGAISRLVASPELRRRLGEAACQLSAAFTWDRIAEQHLEVYRGLA